MQDAPERIWATEDKANFGEDRFHSTTPMRGLTAYTRTDLCITEAECQRRVDAAVLAEREVLRWAHDTLWEINPSNYSHDDVCLLNAASVEVILGIAPLIGETHGKSAEWWADRAAAIRARGQK